MRSSGGGGGGEWQESHLYVLVLPGHCLDHLLDSRRQVFRIFVDGKFGVAKAQHAAAARGHVQQRALLCALNLQLEIFLRALVEEDEGDNDKGEQRAERREIHVDD